MGVSVSEFEVSSKVVVRSANTTESVLFAELTTTINFGNASITNSKIERSGTALRWWLLVANVGLLVISSGLPFVLTGMLNVWYSEGTQIFYSVLQVQIRAPIAIYCMVIAWGPGAVWLRCGLLVPLAVTSAMVPAAFRSLVFIASEHKFYVENVPVWLVLNWATDSTSMIAMAVSMTMFLMLVGSFLRLRWGPTELATLRVSILGVMAATALIAGVIILNAYAHLVFLRHAAPGAELSINDLRLNSAVMALMFGPFYGVLAAIGAWSASSHIAKMLVATVSVGVFFLFYFARQGDELTGLSYAIGLSLAAVWIVFNIRVLARSGWVLSRR